MTALIYEFIHKCDSSKITPDESHIDWFLSNIDRMEYKDNFIKFCFYYWERRHDEKFITKILEHIE